MLSQTCQKVQEIAWGALSSTLPVFNMQTFPSYKLVLSLKFRTFQTELCLHGWMCCSLPCLCWLPRTLPLPPVGGKENKTFSKAGSGSYRELWDIISLRHYWLLNSRPMTIGIRYISMCFLIRNTENELVCYVWRRRGWGEIPGGEKKAISIWALPTRKAGLMTAIFQVGKVAPPVFPCWDSACVHFKTINHFIVARLMSTDRNNSG